MRNPLRRPRFRAIGAALAVAPAMMLGLVHAAEHVDAAHGDGAVGKKVFTEVAQPACAICHTLEAAGATGEIGPSLDDLQPDAQRVTAAVRQGVGAMPSYADSLSDAEIEAVAKFVAGSAGR